MNQNSSRNFHWRHVYIKGGIRRYQETLEASRYVLYMSFVSAFSSLLDGLVRGLWYARLGR